MPALRSPSPPASPSSLRGSGLGAVADLAALALRAAGAGAGGLGDGLGGSRPAAAGTRLTGADRAGAGGGWLRVVHGGSPCDSTTGGHRWTDFRRDDPFPTVVCDEPSARVPDRSRSSTQWSKACAEPDQIRSSRRLVACACRSSVVPHPCRTDRTGWSQVAVRRLRGRRSCSAARVRCRCTGSKGADMEEVHEEELSRARVNAFKPMPVPAELRHLVP